MYQSLLTFRYLRTKVMPLLAALAVMLCTAMVLVVWSVMGGFLVSLLSMGRAMIGDVSIAFPVVGIPHYQQLLDDLEADPAIAAAAPTIESIGMLALETGEQRVVTLVGVDPERYHAVTDFFDRLWWTPITEPLPRDELRADPRLDNNREPLVAPFITRLIGAAQSAGISTDSINALRTLEQGRARAVADARSTADARSESAEALLDMRDIIAADLSTVSDDRYPALQTALEEAATLARRLIRDNARLPRLAQIERDGRTLTSTDPITGESLPAMVMGLELTRYYQRDPAGFVLDTWGVFNPDERYTLATVPLSRRAVVVQPEYRSLPVANEFRTGMYEVDSGWIILPLELLQSMLKLDEARRLDPDWRSQLGAPGPPPTVGTTPARVTHILIRAADGYTAAQVEERTEDIYERFASRHPGAPIQPGWRDFNVYQWENKPGLSTFIAAVKKETALVLTLFAFISLTAAFLVCAIFWAMVSEKTLDIGILRAVGASRAGVAWLYLRFGLAIGITGSLLGGILAYLIVRNINPIHEWMGNALGIVIWDPAVYYFTDIPNEVDPVKAAYVLTGGILFSVLGALLPALRAAYMHPVHALRFE